MLLFLLSLVWSYGPDNQLDINAGPTLEQVVALPVDSAVAVRIYEYVQKYGRLNSIYELLKIEGVTPRVLERLKPLIRVTPRDWDEIRETNIQRVQRRLAAEEGPSRAVVEEWGDLLLTPLNINRARVDDLLALENVSLVDAAAVVRYLRQVGKLESRRDLASRVDGLSSYGYRGMRNYVTYSDRNASAFSGNYRISYDAVPDWFVQADISDFDAALKTLVEDSAEFRNAGFTEEELASIRARLVAEREFVEQMRNQATLRHRVRLRVGDRVRAGAWGEHKLYSPGTLNGFKGFGLVQDVGPVRRLIVGDYRLTLGQGLVMDNNSELVRRTQERAQGLFNDLTENPGFGLRGAAGDLSLWRMGLIGFYSSANRDAILNPDSSVNYYVITTPRYPTFGNVLRQQDVGGNLRLDLSEFLFVPIGTRIGLSGLRSSLNRPMRPSSKYLDLPGDGTVIDDPNYTRLDSGRTRLFYGTDFRTVVENLSVEGEFGQQRGGGKAYLLKTRTQYDYLYVTCLYRHYDVDYCNPYNRGYCEQLRFEDTPLEKTYRLLDPAFAGLQEFPMPKAEEGFLVDTRYQIGRQVTFTRVYLDVWRNLAWAADNVRFQGEVEYRPVFPLRLRFKQKLQSKQNPRVTGANQSWTLESTVRAMLSLGNWDYLTAEVRFGKVLLTPTLKYGDEVNMSGDIATVQWEHNFSEDLNVELGVSVWDTRGMSQWAFEDIGIDFFDGQGLKWYVAISDRVSDNLLLYLKCRHKASDFARTGLGGNEGVHYGQSTEPIRGFIARDNRFDVALQLDVIW